MKLARLVYEAIRDAIEFPSGFNYEGFIRGDFDPDRDFSTQISFAFNYVNLAFARLRSEHKLLLKLAKKASDANGYIAFDEGEVTAVTTSKDRDYRRVQFKEWIDGIAVEGAYVQKVLYIEYLPAIPHFDLDSIRDQSLDDDNEETYVGVDVDLKDYGITDEMCAYVKEYVKGGLLEYLSPELSQRHIQMAEAYFSGLKTRYTSFPQREVENRYGSGGAW